MPDMEFEWDEAKALANLRKHNVGFRDAARIFEGPVIEFPDTRREYGEARFVAVGAFEDLIFKVVFTRREKRIRIISAWRASGHEARAYRSIHP